MLREEVPTRRSMRRPPTPPRGPAHRGPPRRRWRTRLGPTITTLACTLIVLALLAPDPLTDFSAASLLRIPGEGIVLAALLLVLPRRARTATALLGGATLGLVTLLVIVDTGFHQVFDRPAHLAEDWPLLAGGLDYVAQTSGRTASVALAIGAALAAVALPIGFALCAVRAGHLIHRQRARVALPLAGLAVVWPLLAAGGVEPAPGRPVAARNPSVVVQHHVSRVRSDLRDREEYARQLAEPPVVAAPVEALSGLRGKDVVLAFVESYGRYAIEDPAVAPGVTAALTTAERDLAAAGFTARSGFLSSPTVGGGSWLAHSTLLSGTWVDNQARYTDLLDSTHPTLVRDFSDAGWRTVAALPGTLEDWPQGSFYGYDRIYAGRSLGYRGPRFSWSPMPDQYVMSAIQRLELGQTRTQPIMVDVSLTSSHKPWMPLPQFLDWDDVGDGSVYAPMPAAGPDPRDFVDDVPRQRTAFGESVQYTLQTLSSFLTTYGSNDPSGSRDTVMVMLGDHQPLPSLIGTGASRDVPITIIARDPAVLDRTDDWGWSDGLLPQPDAPVWRMDEFRERFVTTFSGSRP